MYTLGGVDESGRNMTAYEFANGDIVICDMGFQLSNLILYNDEVATMKLDDLIEKDIIANVRMLDGKMDKVVGIAISHAHLDHVGAVQYMASLFKCPIYATPYTIEVLKVLMKSSRNRNFPPLKNKFIKLNINSKINLTGDLSLEFINITHSIPQTVVVSINSKKEGKVIYGLDFKFDNRPILGLKSNYKRLEELRNENVILAVVDSVRSNSKRKTVSETVVKEMLRDIFIESNIENTQGIIITTFASHIERLKSIVELTKELGRKIIFMGRSMEKYTTAAQRAGLLDFKQKGVIICTSPREVNKWFDIAQKNKKDYVIVCTGHQGEPNAVLSRVVEKRTPFNLENNDKLIFSSEVIPTQINIEQSKILQTKLSNFQCQVYRDIHTSGHASKEDIKTFVDLIRPKNIVPAHGHIELKEGAIEACEEFGYKQGKTLHILKDGICIDIK